MMNSARWSQIGKLFDEASSLPATERAEWLDSACGDDDALRAQVEHLLTHDGLADQDGFLDQPEVADPARLPTGSWRPAVSRDPVAEPEVSFHGQALPGEGTDCFSPKAAITSGRSQRSAEETRSVMQSRIRELPLLYIPIFATIVVLRPVVLDSLPMAILAPFGIVTATFAGIAILLSARKLSLAWLWRIELFMTVLLAGLIVVYEGRAIMGPFLQVDRIRAEKVMKNVILLVSLLMLVDAIYVPKGWRRAAIVSSSLALLPMATLAGAYLFHSELVRWVGEPRRGRQ